MMDKQLGTRVPLAERLLCRASAHRAKGNDFDANLLEEAASAIPSSDEVAKYDSLSDVQKAHRLDPRHPHDCECHACWIVKEHG